MSASRCLQLSSLYLCFLGVPVLGYRVISRNRLISPAEAEQLLNKRINDAAQSLDVKEPDLTRSQDAGEDSTETIEHNEEDAVSSAEAHTLVGSLPRCCCESRSNESMKECRMVKHEDLKWPRKSCPIVGNVQLHHNPGQCDEEHAREEQRTYEGFEFDYAQAEEHFREQRRTRSGTVWQPDIRVYICFQANVDLSHLTGVHGLSVSLGIAGAVHVNTKNNCWRTSFEVSMGFNWAFKVYGYTTGVSLSATGSTDISEVPFKTVLNDPEAYNNSAYAPDGADLSKCHTGSPWTLIETYILHEYSRIFEQNRSIVTKAEEKNQMIRAQHEIDVGGTYSWLSNSSFHISPIPERAVIFAPRLSAAAMSMLAAVRFFIAHLPAYADHVITRVTDNNDLTGTDGTLNLWGWEKNSYTRMHSSKGRFLARWVSRGDLKKISDESGRAEDDLMSRKERRGVTKAFRDERVMNFAKIARVAKDTNSSAHFWKEFAMSAGNLFVRIVADVKALFGVAFSQDAGWDGSCVSMPGKVSIGKLFNMRYLRNVMKGYSLASGSTKQWATMTAALKVATKLRALPKGLRSELEQILYPHLWCALATHAQEEAMPLEVSILQSCQTVVVEECQTGTDDPTVPKRTSVESRPECESTVLPVAFLNSFPSFARFVRQGMQAMEISLLKINVCLGELLQHDVLIQKVPMADLKRVLTHVNCASDSWSQLDFVRATALEAVRQVRQLLLQLGARIPKDVPDHEDGLLPVTPLELKIIRQHSEDAAALVDDMDSNFKEAFGVATVDTDELAKWVDQLASTSEEADDADEMNRSEIVLLAGKLWGSYPVIKSRLLPIARPLDRLLKNPALRLRPALEIASTISVQFLLNKINFCSSKTALIQVQKAWSTTRRTWSPRVSDELCHIARLRPGDTWIQIFRCEGSLGGRRGEFSDSADWSDYVDWRVRFMMNLVKGNVLKPGESGALGNIFSGGGPLDAAMITGATVAGASASLQMTDAFVPHLHKSPALSALLMTATATTPLAGSVLASALVDGIPNLGTFKDVCLRFLEHLSHHGIIAAPGPAAKPDEAVAYKLDVQLLAYWTVIHRQKAINVKANVGHPRRLSDGIHQPIQRFVKARVMNRNRFSLTPPSFGLVDLVFFVNLHFEFDITPWVETLFDQKFHGEYLKRVAKCADCLFHQKAFCDWRTTFGTLWKAADDVCVEDSNESRIMCEADGGVVDDKGHPIKAVYHSRSGIPCSELFLPTANKEFNGNEHMRRFADSF